MSKNLKKPNLKKPDVLTDLFDDITGEVVELNLNNLIDFKNHPFYVNEDEALDDLLESIKKHGVLTPLLVRPITNKATDNMHGTQISTIPTKYEKLAGHRRSLAAKMAGFTTVPARIFRNLSDEDAMAIVIETNLMQRSFADMRHSEKAAVIALHHSEMFSQGKRNDILEGLAELEGLEGLEGEESKEMTSAEVAAPTSCCNSEKSSKAFGAGKKVADMYSLSSRTVSRYLRINKLVPFFKKMLDDGHIDFLPAVTLSFLTENEQEMIAHYCITADTSGCRIDTKKADLLRELSKTGELCAKTGLKVLQGDFAHKKPRPATIKINSGLYGQYFTKEQSSKEVADIVERALEVYFRGDTTNQDDSDNAPGASENEQNTAGAEQDTPKNSDSSLNDSRNPNAEENNHETI
ncbi:MAG: ParB N-terminal domain-containing protein [Defluviitaleaceae bacterium]|nr:ParB N-terminal domain-containing protein [Defluviitaleaceae bacterium]